jgi:hypothetical protein
MSVPLKSVVPVAALSTPVEAPAESEMPPVARTTEEHDITADATISTRRFTKQTPRNP